jgi:hypothetical protein
LPSLSNNSSALKYLKENLNISLITQALLVPMNIFLKMAVQNSLSPFKPPAETHPHKSRYKNDTPEGRGKEPSNKVKIRAFPVVC